MSDKILVVAPHPDDETLGCGGTLLRHKKEGAQVYWLIGTAMDAGANFTKDQIQARHKAIEAVTNRYGFSGVHQAGFAPAALDQVPMADLIAKFKKTFEAVRPEVVYLPFRGDAHSDHAAVFDAAAACLKWFRCDSVKRILCYETLSETDAALRPDHSVFRANVFVDISEHLKAKLEIMKIYAEETGEHPFPRSARACQALAEVRGAASGFEFAEAFNLVWERR